MCYQMNLLIYLVDHRRAALTLFLFVERLVFESCTIVTRSFINGIIKKMAIF